MSDDECCQRGGDGDESDYREREQKVPREPVQVRQRMACREVRSYFLRQCEVDPRCRGKNDRCRDCDASCLACLGQPVKPWHAQRPEDMGMRPFWSLADGLIRRSLASFRSGVQCRSLQETKLATAHFRRLPAVDFVSFDVGQPLGLNSQDASTLATFLEQHGETLLASRIRLGLDSEAIVQLDPTERATLADALETIQRRAAHPEQVAELLIHLAETSHP